MWREFKDFAMKGNVMDLAVGVIIGGAFGKIVTSLVDNVIMPVVGLMIGGLNFAALQLQIGKTVIMYGAFLQNVVDFLIIAFVIFLMVKAINRLHKKEEAAAPVPAPSHEEVLLAEIRDLLKAGR
jgi:large conductance mechanosensitive channel